MGIAIIAKNVNFAQNLGVVTPITSVPLRQLSIVSDGGVNGVYTLTAVYTPSDTSQRAIVWSIESGGQYATIDQNGILTASSDADENTVTVKATSVINPSIYATIDVSVSAPSIIFKSALVFDGNSAIDTGIEASMPTEIQVTLAGVNPASWPISSGTTRTSVIIGGRASSSSKRRDIQLQATGGQTSVINQIVYGVGNSSKDVASLSLSASAELFLAQGPTYYRYNETVLQRASTDTFDSTVHYVIGAQNNNGTIQYTYASRDKFKRVKIFASEGGTLLRDFVPATQNGVPGMWDNVSQTFFANIGTGTLTVE